MSAAVAMPNGTPVAVEFRYTQSEGFVDLLQQLGASLLVSTYQARADASNLP